MPAERSDDKVYLGQCSLPGVDERNYAMHSMKRVSALAIGLAAAGALLLSGCGSSTTAADPAVAAAPAVSAPITESVVVAPVGTSLSEVQDLCAAAGITLESALLESLSKLPKAEVIPVIRRVALAESVSKPLTSVPIAVAGKVPDKDVFSWLKS